jgi:hypothetical protein
MNVMSLSYHSVYQTVILTVYRDCGYSYNWWDWQLWVGVR